jgi:hypothetical protein
MGDLELMIIESCSNALFNFKGLSRASILVNGKPRIATKPVLTRMTMPSNVIKLLLLDY